MTCCLRCNLRLYDMMMTNREKWGDWCECVGGPLVFVEEDDILEEVNTNPVAKLVKDFSFVKK